MGKRNAIKVNKSIAFVLTFFFVSFSYLIFAKTSFATWAAKLSDKDHYEWNVKYKDAKPEFKVGDIITWDKKNLLEPFVPPAHQALMFHENMAYDIYGLPDTHDYHFPPMYNEATKKFYGQPKIGPKGELLNYTAGMPFPEEFIREDDPQSGFKIGWNFEFKFDSTPSGVAWEIGENPTSHIDFIFVEPGEHTKTFGYPEEMFKEGVYKRYMKWRYKKYWYRHRVDLPQSNYTVPLPESDVVRWKELITFYEPYDVKGVTQLSVRYDDPFRADDAWMYIPSMRRVRRLATGQRADSLLGSELTLDDYFGFSGRHIEWDWKYICKKDTVGYLNAGLEKYTDGKPHGCAPAHSRLEVRHTYCVELKARYDHPYSKKIMYIDTQTYRHFMFIAFDRAGKLWKTYFTPFIWTDAETQYEKIFPNWKGMSMHGTSSHVIQGSCICYDHQKDRGTIAPVMGYYHDMDLSFEEVKETFTLDKLRELGK